MPTVPLADYLKPEHVVWDLPSTDKLGILKALAAAVAVRLPDAEEGEILDLLEKREFVQSTGIGDGLALPHAMVPGLDRTFLLVGRVDPPADYSALDGRPVDLIFLLLNPPEGQKQHLRMLARIARVIGQPAFLERFRQATGPEEAHRLLIEEDARHV